MVAILPPLSAASSLPALAGCAALPQATATESAAAEPQMAISSPASRFHALTGPLPARFPRSPWSRNFSRIRIEYEGLLPEVRQICEKAFLRYLEGAARHPEWSAVRAMDEALNSVLTPEAYRVLLRQQMTRGEIGHFMLHSISEARRMGLEVSNDSAGKRRSFPDQARLLEAAVADGRVSRSMLAERTGCSIWMVSGIVRGATLIPAGRVSTFAECLGMPPDELEGMLMKYRRRHKEEERRKSAKEFGAMLRTMRRAKGVTQHALEARAGLSRDRMNRFESGVALPSAIEVAKIARALGVAAGEAKKLEDAITRLRSPPVCRPYARSAALILAARRVSGLSSGKMAEKLGITAPRYRAIENGHYPLPERLIGRFADEAKVGSNTVKEAIISDRRNPLASNVAHPYREGALLIDAAIRKQGWRTRKEAAARLGIRAEELSSIATGRLPVPARMIERLAAALDIPLSTLKEAYGRK